MVVLQIDGGGYRTAATAFAEANQLTALAATRLRGVLASCGGMAGDDTTSAAFAAAYDAAAAEAVASLADLTDACTSLGHLTRATLDNHTRANSRAVVGGAIVYAGGGLPDAGEDSGYVTVLPWTPTTSRGATPPNLPSQVGWILAHLEGFVWPGADVGRLRRAASAWRAAADALADVEGCCDSAVRGFWLERSPEVPRAVEATGALRARTGAVAASLAALGSACDSYADAVEAKHAEILDLAGWVLEQVVEGVVISVAIGALTGGAGTAAGLAAVAARVAAESPRFAALLEALRVLAEGCAATVRAARDALSSTRLNLVRFKDAAVARSLAQGERGELRLAWTQGRIRGWLKLHERPPGHTIARHVGKTDEELIQRTQQTSGPRVASSFTDEEAAEAAIARALDRDRAGIEAWLASGSGAPHEVDAVTAGLIGRCARPDGLVTDAHGLRVVLIRDATMPEGFHILTAYPTP
ncbi:RNase A-like domain-containing protein [Nocardioides panaciterrulae]|nr:RNase A-like domain-containing protein [Nocardioides panaciterrulae]